MLKKRAAIPQFPPPRYYFQFNSIRIDPTASGGGVPGALGRERVTRLMEWDLSVFVLWNGNLGRYGGLISAKKKP
jgi:hypothetical protein